MTRRGLTTALAALVAAGCAGTPVERPAPAASKKPAKATASATPGPTATATPAPKPAGPPPAPLRKPAAGVTTLRGTVALDAAYAVGVGAAVLANNGASIVSSGFGALVSDHGAGLITNNGGNLIANHGGGLVSNNGGGLVGNNGGAVIANNGAAFRLAGGPRYQALQAGAAPAFGAVLPAAGAVLEVVSPRDDRPVSLGEDAAGKPVMAIYTDGVGAYEVYVPAALAGNVRLRVGLPRAQAAAADARLTYEVLAAAAADKPAVVDEDTSLATRYTREAFAGRFQDFLTTDDPASTVRALTSKWVGAPPALQQLMLTLVTDFQAEAVKVGLNKAPIAEVRRVALRIVDTAISPVDLDAIMITRESNSVWRWPDEPAVGGMTAALRALREGAARTHAADPTAIAKQAWFVEANKRRAARGEPAFEIKKAADVGDLLVGEYYVEDMWGSYDRAKEVYGALGVLVDAKGVDQADRISAASSAILQTTGQALFLDQDGAKTACIALIRAWKPLSEPRP